VLLLNVAVIATGVRLSIISWTAVTLFVALLASLWRTGQFARWHRRAAGRAATWRELAAAFGFSAVIVGGILSVGLGIFCFVQISVILLFRGPDLSTSSRPVLAWAIHLTPTILAMAWAGKSLWPIKEATRTTVGS
jgi:hypothetical protein